MYRICTTVQYSKYNSHDKEYSSCTVGKLKSSGPARGNNQQLSRQRDCYCTVHTVSVLHYSTLHCIYCTQVYVEPEGGSARWHVQWVDLICARVSNSYRSSRHSPAPSRRSPARWPYAFMIHTI